MAKADSALYPENPQFNLQSTPKTHGKARPPGLRSAAASFRASCHLQQNAPSNPLTTGAPKKLNSILLGPNALGPSSALRGWHRPPVPHTRCPAAPSEGGPRRGQQQLSRLGGRLRDHRPATASSPQRRGCRRSSARAPLSPAPAPAPPPPAAASGLGRPYLEGSPERVEGTVQQQGGPAVAEQPQQLPEQHPSWAGGGAGSGRPGEGAERAGSRGVGSHPFPERDCPNFNSGGEGGKAGGKEGGREAGRWAGGEGKEWSGKPRALRVPAPSAGRRASTPALPTSLLARPHGFPSPGCSGCRCRQPLRAGASRQALTAEPEASSHTGGERRREKFGAGRGGKEPGPEGRGGAAAQPGHCISPQPAAAAAVIFQAHRGSPFRARLPSSLPPRPDSSRGQLPPLRRLGDLRERRAPRPPPRPPAAEGKRRKNRHPRPHPRTPARCFWRWWWLLFTHSLVSVARACPVTGGTCGWASPVSLGCNREDASWHLWFYVPTKHAEMSYSA